jgi:hypothetical protein
LHVIAQLLPRRDQWRTPLFDQLKTMVKERFKIGSNAFSDALDVIQSSRETKAMLGLESELLHISDSDILWLVEQWRKLHPPRQEGDVGGGIVSFSDASFDEMMQGLEERNIVIDGVAQRLSADQLADIQAVFYIGRNREYAECYEAKVENTKRRHAVESDLRKLIADLLDKTNFLSGVQQAITRLGRLKLSQKLRILYPLDCC